jgi:nucleoside-diphosphate-sugar epimerase
MTSNRVPRVAVFGASGNIGRHVVNQLLAAGHIVTAYVRNPAKLTTTHPNIGLPQRPHRARRHDASRHYLGPRLDHRSHDQPE